MQEIIPPVDRALLEQELNSDRFVRETNNGANLIYIITFQDSPNVLREIGRLREITFRAAGGGTGLDCDIDAFDTAQAPYRQLVVWNPVDREIVGGYRYIECNRAPRDAHGNLLLATTELFRFSPLFMREFIPYTIELGRSFVQPRYQPSGENRKGLFSLDNLWDGLGAIVVDHPDIRYFFGKVTMYRHFNSLARDMILTFMHYYFPDPDHLVESLKPLPVIHEMKGFLDELAGQGYKDGHRILNGHVRQLDENIPPLVNSYMNLSATMRTFGTSLNDHFGEVEETGIMVTIADIYPTKKERHISTYRKTRKH